MKKLAFVLTIFTITLLAMVLTVTPAWAGLSTPAWTAVSDNGDLGEQVTTGDFNGDGYLDIVAGADSYNGGQGVGQGGVFVWEGSASGYGDPGTVTNADWSLIGEAFAISDYLGSQITVGDFNGDTYDDLVVNCTYCDESYGYEGVVYVYFGSDTGLPANPTKGSADWRFALGQEFAYGASSLVTGDVNGDSYDDLIVGSSRADNGQIDEGVVFVWEGSTSGLGPNGTIGNADWVAQSNVESAEMGTAIAVGDLNGDGYSDLAIGTPYIGEGRVYVWEGSASGLGTNGTPSNADWHAEGAQVGSEFAVYSGSIVWGDFDGDTYDDLAVGAYRYHMGEASEGAVFIWRGSFSGLGATGTPSNADWHAEGEQSSAYLGKMITTGDFSGNGYDDLAAIKGTANNGYVLFWYGSGSFLGANGTPANADEHLDTEVEWAKAADTDNNGFADLVAGEGDVNTVYLYLWESPPTNPTTVIETGGAQDHVWQNDVSNPAFTWSGASDDSAVDGYFVYFGDDPEGTSATYVLTEAYDPPAVSDGEYYLRISTQDDEGNQAPWETLFTLRYDGTAPGNPTAATETGGAANNTWQNTVSDPAFTWSGAADALSGVARYYVYFGSNASGTSSTYTTSAAYNPGAVSSGTYYLRVRTQDQAGNQAGWTTLFTLRYDGTAPTNPTSVTETGGAQDNVWQNDVSNPAFTWSGASDGHSGEAPPASRRAPLFGVSGVDGYYVYFGSNPAGTAGTYITSAAYDPGVVSSGTYYLRVRTRDNIGNLAGWETIFTLRYDDINPSNPTTATETGGAQDDTWQNEVSDPAFTWSGAADTHSGVEGYFVYFGSNPSGTSGTYTSSAAYDPGAVSSGTYYLRLRTQDEVGNLAGWVTLFTFRYDGTIPSNPTAVIESGGAQDNVWQNGVSDPAFTWSGASDDSAVEGYFVYFGDDPQGTSAAYVLAAAYDPPAVSNDSTYYLRISTQDDSDNQAPWETLFTFRYDDTNPSNPTAATELGGAQDDVWQNDVSDPSFDWSGATDVPSGEAPPASESAPWVRRAPLFGVSGVNGYFVYFGEDPNGTTETYVFDPAYDPPAVSAGVYYLRVSTQDEAGNLADWTTLFTFRYKTSWTLFLPLVSYDLPPVVIPSMDETEPNNLFEEADLVAELPIKINGKHDGDTGGGDVFMLDDNLMTAGDVVQASIETGNPAGLQLVAYNPQGQEIARAYDGEFVVSFVVPASGTYYLYVYTDPGASNVADYVLTVEILP